MVWSLRCAFDDLNTHLNVFALKLVWQLKKLKRKKKEDLFLSVALNLTCSNHARNLPHSLAVSELYEVENCIWICCLFPDIKYVSVPATTIKQFSSASSCQQVKMALFTYLKFRFSVVSTGVRSVYTCKHRLRTRPPFLRGAAVV